MTDQEPKMEALAFATSDTPTTPTSLDFPTTFRELYLWITAQRNTVRAAQSCHDCNGDARELYAEEYAYNRVLQVMVEMPYPVSDAPDTQQSKGGDCL